ncbi:GNAT family N-acetyltransferase [Eubacterium sp.]
MKLGVFIADEKYRNKGYGTLAIKKIMLFAKDLGYKSIVLNVRISNIKAFNVYQNIGFKETKRFTKSNGVDVIQMEHVI